VIEWKADRDLDIHCARRVAIKLAIIVVEDNGRRRQFWVFRLTHLTEENLSTEGVI